MKVTGKRSFRTYDLLCPGCAYYEERSVDFRECETEEDEKAVMQRELQVRCPNCDEHDLDRVWMKAPMGRVGGEGSDRSIASMKESFKQRFVKKELDDCRHRFGKLFDDSIRSAAAQRIKKETGE